MTNKNLETVKTLYDLYQRDPVKGVESLFDLLADELVWSTDGEPDDRGLKFAADRHSKEEVKQYFSDVAQEWQVVGVEIEHFTAQDDRVFVSGVGRWKNLRTGKELKTRKVDFYRFEKGRVIEFREFFDTQKVALAGRGQS